MEKTLSEELNEMADEVEKKREAAMKPKLNVKRFFSGFGWAEVVMSLAMVGMLGVVIGPTIYCYKTKANKPLVSQHQVIIEEHPEVKGIIHSQEYKDKHWANVLILIHPRDAKRAAEIIAEADKPNELLKTSPFEDYEARSYSVTRELEELLRKKNVRYQRKEYENEEKLNNMLERSGAHIRLYVTATPFINW